MVQEMGKQKMRFFGILLILVAVTLLISPLVWADLAPPRTTVNIYFERNNTPVNQTVTFTMNCSAFDNPRENQPNTINKLGDLFSYSAICPSYGCFSYLYQYMPYENLTSCDLFGELDGEQFTILNAQNPFSCTISTDWKKQSCELHINLSSVNFTAIKTQATKTPTPPYNTVLIMESPTTELGRTNGVFADFICFLKNLLGGTC